MNTATKTTIIIGGGSGIGVEVARGLLARGERVVVASRLAYANAAQALGCPGECVDARDFAQVEALLARHAPVTGLVCAAGSILIRPAHLTSEVDFLALLDTNLKTAFACVRAAARHMTGGGSVVLFSSVAAQVGLPHHEAIAAAKGGVEALVRSAAASHAARGLRFNAIAPALVETGLAEKLIAKPAMRAASEAMIPLGRLGQPGEIAQAALWLLGAEATWMTGQVLCLDGGMSALRTPARTSA